jgi:hypothetical protein
MLSDIKESLVRIREISKASKDSRVVIEYETAIEQLALPKPELNQDMRLLAQSYIFKKVIIKSIEGKDFNGEILDVVWSGDTWVVKLLIKEGDESEQLIPCNIIKDIFKRKSKDSSKQIEGQRLAKTGEATTKHSGKA